MKELERHKRRGVIDILCQWIIGSSDFIEPAKRQQAFRSLFDEYHVLELPWDDLDLDKRMSMVDYYYKMTGKKPNG